MAVRASPEHAVAAGLGTVSGRSEPSQPELEKLADGRGAGRHAVLEAEIVDRRQLFRRQHDLETFASDVGQGAWLVE